MRRQFLVIGAVLLIAASVWILLSATPVRKQVSPKCSKTCQTKTQSTTVPQTGFFIFDSFSGIL